MATRSNSDKRLISGISLGLYRGAQDGSTLADDVNDGNLDRAMDRVSAGLVQFQFPPKVTSDGKRHNWLEKDVYSYEPLALPQSSSPRDISLSFTYIYDDIDGWGWKKIKDNLRNIRGYFYRFVNAPDRSEAMLVYLRIWGIAGQSLGKFRMKGCDIKYSETMIIPEEGPKFAFPYRSDVTLDLSAWNKFQKSVATEDETGFSDEIGEGTSDKDLEVPGEWY